MSGSNLISYLESLGACDEGIKWASAYTDIAAAWDNCERGDWMMWFLATTGADQKQLALAACEIARTVVHLAKSPEAVLAIEVTEDWAKGKGSITYVRTTARVLCDVPIPDDVAAADALDAAYTAVYLASSCACSNCAAFVVEHCVNSLRAATGLDETVTYKRCADIVRSNFSCPVIE